MPLYDYACRECGHHIKDRLVKRWDLEQTISCPECRFDMHRLVSRTSFRLVGPGWGGYIKSVTKKGSVTTTVEGDERILNLG